MKKVKKILGLLLAFIFVFSLTACDTQKGGANAGKENAEGANKTASTEKKADGEAKEYIVVLGPNDSGTIAGGSEGIIEEMNIALEPFNATVSYIHADDYSVVSESLLSGTGHIGFGSGATYVTAHLENDKVEPLFTYAPDGDLEKAGYPGYIAVNAANKGDFEGLEGEEALKALKDKSFAFVSATSTSGRVVPTTTFWKIFGPEGTGDVKEKSAIFEKTSADGGLFSEVQFSGSHPASVEMLANDRIYAAAYCCDFAAGQEDKLHIIYEQTVPGDPFWANLENMEPEHVEAIISHFEKLTPENVTSDKIFAPADVEEVGIDSDYVLKNNERFIKVEPSYYDFVVEMFADEK